MTAVGQIAVSRLVIIVCFHTLAAFPTRTFATPAASDTSSQNERQVYKQLQSLAFDPAKVATVKNFVLEKDRAKVLFRNGEVYLAEPTSAKITGAVFLGDGFFELIPPTEIERAQVRRFLGQDAVQQNFSAAYLRFTDQTADQLSARLDFGQARVPNDVPKMHDEISEMFLEDLGTNLASRILGGLVNGPEEGVFIAVLEHEAPGLMLPNYFIFSFDPNQVEEISAFQYFPHRVNKPLHTLCSFHQRGDYGGGASKHEIPDENKAILKIGSYEMNLELEKSGELNAEVEIAFQSRVAGLKLATFDLHKQLHVEQIKSSEDDSLAFFREKDETSFSVIFNEALAAGSEEKLTVSYSGEILENFDGNLFLKDKQFWFPRYGYLVPAVFDITYKYPQDRTVVSVGKLVERWQVGDYAYSRWVEDVPALAAAFALGRFDSTIYSRAAPVGVRVYSTKSRRGTIREKIGGDVSNSLYILQNYLGYFPYSGLDVVESPGLFSQGYPGILFLSSLTFASELEGVMEALRAHEVSHQWWGNIVGWETYHDQWLSEALAEYSGALLAQFTLDGDKMFFRILEGWRNDLLEGGHVGVSIGLRRFGFSKDDLALSEGMKAGPIWLGHRLGSKHPVDYFVVVYEKGAYVIHMLRTLMRDFESGSDHRFWAMLADFVNTFKGQRATTEDFQKVVERHTREQMDWFFNQWIFGTEVPTYVYSYDFEVANAQHWVDLKVRQEDVPADFKMFVPVTIELPSGVKATELIWVQGSTQTLRLGPFEHEPHKIVFNDFAGVLARVRKK